MTASNVFRIVFGILSNVSQTFVFVPQFHELYVSPEKYSGVSFGLILCWFTGDVLALASAVHLELSPVIVYSQCTHILFDAAYILHWNWCKYKWNTRDRARTFVPAEILAVAVFLTAVSVVEFTMASTFVQCAYGYGVVASVLFGYSRIPQIMLNRRRRDTSGLCASTFIFVCLANNFLLASILQDVTQEFFWKRNGLWVASLCTSNVLDTYVFYQMWTYRDTTSTSTSTSVPDETDRLLPEV